MACTNGGSRIREFDEFYCPKCGNRWATDEDRPDCEPLEVEGEEDGYSDG